jgi:hypothetical protein
MGAITHIPRYFVPGGQFSNLAAKLLVNMARAGRSNAELDFGGLVQDYASSGDVADSRAISLSTVPARVCGRLGTTVYFRGTDARRGSRRHVHAFDRPANAIDRGVFLDALAQRECLGAGSSGSASERLRLWFRFWFHDVEYGAFIEPGEWRCRFRDGLRIGTHGGRPKCDRY